MVQVAALHLPRRRLLRQRMQPRRRRRQQQRRRRRRVQEVAVLVQLAVAVARRASTRSGRRHLQISTRYLRHPHPHLRFPC